MHSKVIYSCDRRVYLQSFTSVAQPYRNIKDNAKMVKDCKVRNNLSIKEKTLFFYLSKEKVMSRIDRKLA